MEIIPISLGETIKKYSFLSRFQSEQRYGDLLVSHCETIKPDVVISGNTPTLSQCKLVKWGLDQNIPIVTWIQDMYGLAAYRILKKKLPIIGAVAGRYLMQRDAWCYRNSSSVVPITNDFIPQLEQYGVAKNRIRTIANWAPLEEFPLTDRDNYWARNQGLTNSTRFIYSGTLSIRHNPKMLLDLAKEVDAKSLGEVVVISEGDAADWLKSESDSIKSLRVLPFQPFEELPNVLGAADVLLAILEADAGVFCVPSKILTYLCAGRAILTAMPLSNEAARLVKEQDFGFNVEPGDSETFIRQAIRLANDREFCWQLGKNARDYAERQFDIALKVREFSDVLMLQNQGISVTLN
ncbi:glycosyltransferase family 4 protein [Neorhodopirellula pilleata]|uniref:glycosyltransferase family 4 protein n=1 Tax=Neorhodopirellula pilleata TaxID=2714738 RepID=UPI0011B687FF|nr:glycosyltransferase family 4 protein [Neorhodopirellula pilleata]